MTKMANNHSEKVKAKTAERMTAVTPPPQRMASITNALVSQPSPVTFGSPARPSLRQVLPPITQQQVRGRSVSIWDKHSEKKKKEPITNAKS